MEVNANHIYIYQHLGIGDHLICSSIVRHVCKYVKEVSLFVKDVDFYQTSIRFLFRDLPNLKIIPSDDHSIQQFLKTIPSNEQLIIGHHNTAVAETFEHAFYKQFNLPLSGKWSEFYVERDLEREEELFDRLNLPEKYIFVQDDPTRGMPINWGRVLPSEFAPFTPSLGITNNLFDYLTVIERAQEVHVIDSSFMFMIDLVYPNFNKPLYVHRYARQLIPWSLPINRLQWNILS